MLPAHHFSGDCVNEIHKYCRIFFFFDLENFFSQQFSVILQKPNFKALLWQCIFPLNSEYFQIRIKSFSVHWLSCKWIVVYHDKTKKFAFIYRPKTRTKSNVRIDLPFLVVCNTFQPSKIEIRILVSFRFSCVELTRGFAYTAFRPTWLPWEYFLFGFQVFVFVFLKSRMRMRMNDSENSIIVFCWWVECVNNHKSYSWKTNNWIQYPTITLTVYSE